MVMGSIVYKKAASWSLLSTLSKAIALFLLLGLQTIAFAKETRVKVAIVDSGMPESLPAGAMCEGGPVDITGHGLKDELRHATAVTCLVMQGIDTKKVCVLPVKYIHIYAHTKDVLGAWSYLIKNRVSYINYSSEGTQPSNTERVQLKRITRSGTVIVAAAGNWNADLNSDCSSFLACYRVKGIRIVGALNGKGGKADYSNWGGVVTDWATDSSTKACGHFTGTSAATAKVLNKILKQAGYGVSK
jgi:hypothetical protein